jgi:hypothetical protein
MLYLVWSYGEWTIVKNNPIAFPVAPIVSAFLLLARAAAAEVLFKKKYRQIK